MFQWSLLKNLNGDNFCKQIQFTVRKIHYCFRKATCFSRKTASSRCPKTEKKKYLKFKTQPNFEFGKAQKGLRLKFEVIWYLKMSITVYVTWC